MHRHLIVLATVTPLFACNDAPPTRSVAHSAPAAPVSTPTDVPGPDPQPAVPEIEWFTGVRNLPPSHACHDAARVRVLSPREGSDGRWEDANEIVSLASQRSTSTEDPWVGPRTVRGARWADATGEHMVVSCFLEGIGFGLADSYWNSGGFAPKTAPWLLDQVTEANRTAIAMIDWMHRSPDGKWHVVDTVRVNSNDDESNQLQFTAWSRVLTVDVEDSDGHVASTAVLVNDCRPYGDRCAADLDVSFVVRVIATDGDEQATQWYLLDDDGKQRRQQRELPDGDGTNRDALMARLDRDQPEALETARHYLRDRKKARRGSGL